MTKLFWKRTQGSHEGISPLVLWFLLFLDLSYLSYFCDLSNEGWAFLTLHGFLVAAVLYLLFNKIQRPEFKSGPASLFSFRFFCFLLLLGYGWRILASFGGHPWPTGDEALQAFLGIHLSNHWEWRFFYTVGQHPPLSIWISAFLLGRLPSAHVFFGVCSAFVSILTLWVWTKAVRSFLPKDPAVVFGSLMAIGFWPVFSGEFYLQMVPLFEGMVLWAAGQWLKGSNKIEKRGMALIWGILTGLGFFTYSSWISVALASVLFFLWSLKREKDIPSAVFYFTSLALISAPFFYFATQEKFGAHLFEIGLTSPVFSLQQKVANSISYWTSLWWGALSKNASNGPVWGGFLNPILGAAFFRGLLGLWKGIRNPSAWGLLFLLVWCMVPGMITADYPSLYRIVQAMPWVLIVAAFGFSEFYREWSRFPFGKSLMVVLLSLSVGLDGVHWAKANQLNWPDLRSKVDTHVQEQNQQAFRILEEVSRQKGPGYILSDFLLLSRNHSLTVETYPFNAALNPRAALFKCRWAALIVNVHYQAALSSRFPGSQWVPIGRDTTDEDGGLVVGILPLDGISAPFLDRWVMAERFFHDRQYEAENILNDPILYHRATEDLSKGYPLMKGDRFLESIYGEWVAQYHFREGLGPNIQALRRAVSRGYPTANLYLKLGNFLYLNGQKSEALKAYSRAVRTKPNYTDAQAILDYLQPTH